MDKRSGINNLNKSEDVRRVIERVEQVDSVHVDEIHSMLNEIAQEKAINKSASQEEKKRSILDLKMPSIRPLVKNEDLEKKEERKESKEPSATANQDPGSYVSDDNITAFID